MSVWGRRISVKAVMAVAAALVFVTLSVLSAVEGRPVLAVLEGPDREIVLVARGMAFYLESDPATPNPTIELNAGERVRIVLRNDDRGMQHDFAAAALGAELDQIGWDEQDAVTVTVPRAAGSYEYECRPHRLMMKGRILVR